MTTKHVSIILIAVFALAACKPSEKNYRAAYERAVAGRTGDEVELDSTIYGKMRRDFSTSTVVLGSDTLDLKRQMVKVTPDGGGIPESLKRYSVVAAQFKQVFTAKSMRERLFDTGYPGTFVVQTAEPYYYVVAGSYNDLQEAVEALKRLKADESLTFKAPLPYILERP